ncbi:MAG: hypothetical protein QM817_35940 [Archangium sp.]
MNHPKATLLTLTLLCATSAHARSDWMNPGEMGSNAVPGFAIEAPWSNDYTLLQFGNQLAYGWRYDVSMLPYWRLVTPFGKWISTYFEGSIVEAWWSSPETRREWGLSRDSGIAKADLRFGFKLLLADLGDPLPKIGFRAFTKTTTGKGYEERRFTDGPAYLLEFLVGEKFPVQGFDLQLLAMGGYWIWQQGESGQNDAITWGLALNSRFFERLTAQVELRGYVGWQKLDKPTILSAKLGVLITSWFEISGAFNLGFRDAPRYEGILTLGFRLPSLAPVLFDFFTPNTPVIKHHE